MKLLIVGDLHGRTPKIPKKEFDAIVLIGDVCSDKEIAPVYKKFFHILKENIEADFDDFINDTIGKKKLLQMEKRSLQEGRKILEKLNSLGKPIFMVAGNWDYSYGKSNISENNRTDYGRVKNGLDYFLGDKINPKLVRSLKNIKNCMYKIQEFEGINFYGYGLSSAPEEIKRKRKKRLKNISQKQFKILQRAYEKILDKLDKNYKKRNSKLPTVFVTHNIPYKTKLDIIKDKKSYAYKKHAGSTVARYFCVKHKPLLCTGGHIHEGEGKDRIRKTIVINPGFNKEVLVEIKNKKVRILKPL